MRTALALILPALLALGAPLAQETPPEEQAPPAENPLPQEVPEVEDAAKPPEPPPPPAMPMVTLGELAVRAAGALNLTAPAGGFTPESAAWALVLKGIRVRAELGSPLTEADAVSLLAGLGFKIRTTTPSRIVTRDRFEILVESFLSGEAKPPEHPATPAPVPPPASPPSEGRP
ncbi:MAG TPA: hypothetical protein VGK94_11145 [Candidatus Polarisedimenticolia bacterium]|jgi:hypothetical protein